MQFFRSLLQSYKLLWQLHTNTAIYRYLVYASRNTILALLSSYYLLFALASTAAFLTLTIPRWQAQLLPIWEELLANWPENLTAEYTNEQLHFAPSEPLQIGYPASVDRPTGFPSLLATVDTSTNNIPTTSSAFAHLSADSLTLFQQGTGSTTPWKHLFFVESWTLNRGTLLELSPRFPTLIQELGVALAPVVFIMSLILVPLSRMLLLLPFVWLVQGLLQLTNNRLTYDQAFRLGALLLPATETIQFLLTNLYPALGIHAFWWIWLMLIGIVTLFNRRPFSF